MSSDDRSPPLGVRLSVRRRVGRLRIKLFHTIPPEFLTRGTVMVELGPTSSGQWGTDKKPHDFKFILNVWEVVGSSPTMTVNAGSPVAGLQDVGAGFRRHDVEGGAGRSIREHLRRRLAYLLKASFPLVRWKRNPTQISKAMAQMHADDGLRTTEEISRRTIVLRPRALV